MKNRERIVIYTLLAGLLALNLGSALDRTGRPAHAQDAVRAGGAGLGPTESVTLVGKAGTENVVLRNADSRLAWGDAAHDRTYSVSYVYIGKILNQLMKSEAIQEERDRLMSDLQETETEYRERLDDLNGRLQGMDPESEDAQRTFEEGRTVYDEYMRWQQAAMVERGQLDAQHLERVYRDLVEAVQVVADRQGIDTVYRFIPTDEAFRSENPEQAMLAIRLRTAIRYPDELDITDDVLEELSLDIE